MLLKRLIQTLLLILKKKKSTQRLDFHLSNPDDTLEPLVDNEIYFIQNVFHTSTAGVYQPLLCAAHMIFPASTSNMTQKTKTFGFLHEALMSLCHGGAVRLS